MMVAFTKAGTAKLLYCGLWSCRICRKQNAQEWANDARHCIRHAPMKWGKPRFWTLTLPSRFKSAAQGYEEIKRLWGNMRKALERDQGKFPYLAFVEGQPKRGGMPHFHIIIYAHVPKRYQRRREAEKNIKDFAVHIGFGHQATDEKITSGKAANYVAKYVSKATPGMPKYFRRVRASQDWIRKPKPQKQQWLVRAIGESVEAYLLRVEAESNRSIDDLQADYSAMTSKMNYERLTA